MSQESIKAFFQVLEDDIELLKQVKGSDNSADIVQLASEKGYVFTKQELEIAAQETVINEELSEEQLEAVAGGLEDIKVKVKVKIGIEF